MVDGCAVGSCVFIHYRESRGGDDIVDTQFLTDGLDEGGLAGAHVAVEGIDLLVAHRVDKLPRCLADMFQIVDPYLHFLPFYFFTFSPFFP